MSLPPAELIVTPPSGQVARYKLGDKAVIGRNAECEIILTDPMSSRRHCSLERAPDGGFFILDPGSANGTFLNAQPLKVKERTTLHNGDTIQIGSTLLVLKIDVPVSGGSTYKAGMSIVSLIDEGESGGQPSINFSQRADAEMLTEEERSTFDVTRLKRVTERLKILIDIAQAMGASLEPHKLLSTCMDKLFEVFPQADRGIIVLYGPGGKVPDKLTVEQEGAPLDRRKGAITKVKQRTVGNATDNEIKLSRTVLKRISSERTSFVIDDATGGEAGASIAKFEIRSLMCAPLLTGSEDLGMIQIETKNRMKRFTDDDLKILTAVAGQVAVVIRNAELALSAAAASAQREKLSRFLSPQLVEEVLNEKLSIELGGVEKRGTVFFSDIVSFTRMAATMAPESVVRLLNRYFTVMQNIIFRRGGAIDKCAGDNIMAHWGVLGNLPHYTESAVTAAIEMQTALFTFNRAEAMRKEEGFHPVMLGHGIGLNTSRLCAGNIGSEHKLEFTVIGDAVNLSARIESVAGRGQTFIGEQTYEEVKTRLFCIRMPDFQVKNVTKPLAIYSVRGVVPPPVPGQEDEPVEWTGEDLYLAMPCSLIMSDGTKVTGIVTFLNALDGKLEMHIEKFVAPGTGVTLEWNIQEKTSLPSFEGEVEACLPVGNQTPGYASASAISRGRTAIMKRTAEPGMLVLRAKNLPPAIAAFKPGLVLPSDLKSHEENVRA